MKVRIAFSETGTGEDEIFNTEVKELSLDCIIDAMNRYQEHCSDGQPIIKLKGESFVTHGSQAAFILTSHDRWFGDMIWTGVVYTEFAGEMQFI